MPKKKHSILVVERTGALSRVVKDVLAPEEYEVVHALTPAIARQDYASLAPALALISVDIPIASTGEKRANEAYAYCRELGGAGVAVIIVEALATQESVVAAARHGAIDMLVTPVDPKVLSTRIHKALVKIGEDLPEPGEKPKLRFPEDAKVPRKRVEYALRKTQGLLALPHAVKAVLRLCSRPDASAADLLGSIESDSALTARAFRLANSVAQASRHRITDLQGAIARLGVKTTASMAMTQSVFDMFGRDGETFGFDRVRFWVHSLGAACCARFLATVVWGQSDPDDAFLAGLLHDIGKMLLDEYLPQEYQDVVKSANMARVPLRYAERTKFEMDHTVVGSRLATQWELPGHIRHAIAGHHPRALLGSRGGTNRPGEADSMLMMQCACLANQLTKAFGFGDAGDYLVEADSLGMWRSQPDLGLNLASMYSSMRDDLGEFLELLDISPRELRLEFGEPTGEQALLCLPDDGPQYQMLLEAFLARHGYSTVTRSDLEKIPAGDGPFGVGIASAIGDLDVVKAVADGLAEHVQFGIVFTDCPEVVDESMELNDRTTAVGPSLDFYALERLLSEGPRSPDASS